MEMYYSHIGLSSDLFEDQEFDTAKEALEFLKQVFKENNVLLSDRGFEKHVTGGIVFLEKNWSKWNNSEPQEMEVLEIGCVMCLEMLVE